MHELSVASSIANSVMDFAKEHRARKILEVRLAVGELTCLAKEQLQFCYHVISKETLIEDSTLAIEEVKAEISCPHCSYKGAPKMWDGIFQFAQVPILQCPECGQGVNVIRGRECTIKNVKYVE